MKLIKPLIAVCLILVAVVAGRNLYKNCQVGNQGEAMIKENEENQHNLSESQKKTSEVRKKMLDDPFDNSGN